LRSALGCSEIRRTLNGGAYSLRNARAIATITGARLRLLFDNVTREAGQGYEVDRDKLTKLVHMILDEELDRLGREVAHRAVGLSADEFYKLERQYSNTALSFSINPWDTSIQALGQELIDKAMNGANSESAQITRDMVQGLDDVGVTELRQAIIKARETAYSAIANSYKLVQPPRHDVHNELDYFFPRPAITNTTPRQQTTQQQTSILQVDIEDMARAAGIQVIKQVTLREAIGIFVESKQSKQSNKERSLDNKKLALKEFRLAIGEDTMTGSIDLATIERFIKLVDCLPNRRGKQQFRPDIWSYIDNPEGKLLDKGTVKTKLSQVKTLLHDMRRRRFVSRDLVESACYKISERCKEIAKGKSRQSKPPFELAHLEALFNPDKFLP
jgi:hypothetical protein